MLYHFLCYLFIIFIILIGFFSSQNCSLLNNYRVVINKPYDKLMIVAHPDDETLWGYHQLKKYKGWKIICVTNSQNKIRVNELKKITKYFNCALEIWNFQDSKFKYNFSPIIYEKIFYEINKKNVKLVLTHNPIGEYGHIQHKKISQVVLSVTNKPTYVFSYSNYNKNNNKICNLKNIYKSQKKIFLEHCKKNTKFKIYKFN